MKITYNWLKEYVDFDWSPEKLGDQLTMLGLEVEGLDRVGGGFEGVRVAEVVTREPHPNADRLSVCRVNDGEGERQIVCGATNFKAGDKVPLILPGSTLPTSESEKPFVIKVGKIRGVKSYGMMCSGKELGTSEDADGLMILNSEASVGQPFAAYLGLEEADYVYDLEITPNRPDLNSVMGIAREVSALTGKVLGMTAVELAESGDAVAEHVQVRIEDAALCSRYSARLIRNVKIGPSPSWLKSILGKIGIRSINNVVDITNYVMMEVGQPLHAFDYHLLSLGSGKVPTVVVRQARAGESFVTLDEQEHQLPEQAVMIADEEKAIALGGIMGGLNSEIGESTKDVLLESAYFNPQSIRATSKKLELRTDASYRFERGVDVGIVDWASRRAARLICELASGQLHAGVVDVFANPPETVQVSLRFEKTNQLLGIEIPGDGQVSMLGRLGLTVRERSDDVCAFSIPTFRVDLKGEVDLIEEVARLYGVDKIPATPPRGAIGAHEYDAVHDELALVRRILVGQGLNEIQGQTLISDSAPGIPRGVEPVALEYPLSSDMNVLRPSLLPGLVRVLQHNANHGTTDVAMFEVGSVFCLRKGEPAEERRLVLAMTGSRFPSSWANGNGGGDFDIFDLKGRLESLLDALGVRGLQWRREDEADPVFVEEGRVLLGKQVIGQFGQLQPVLASNLDLKKAVLLAELDLDLILKRRASGKAFKPLPQFPSIRRDVAMVVDEGVSHHEVMRIVKKAKPDFLHSVEIFDVFRGKGIPEGKKSVAYAFVYRDKERTLKDEEVTVFHAEVVERLKVDAAAEIR
ncbi:MAG: Phenylalanine--tRNA ligase beta subunit [Verrucomicrobia subdivision 3 bacterium]|nr:Phenylalanine--tRNA ligase beta subunit [Limisphaerales bacterium]MCS1416242.1 Phenylalanine--tRNA ligase beta subunit [Limisphaerales bacterium]